MESQKIKNLLDHKYTYSKYQTKKWHIINDQNNGQYGEGDNNDDTVKIDTGVVKPFLRDYEMPIFQLLEVLLSKEEM